MNKPLGTWPPLSNYLEPNFLGKIAQRQCIMDLSTK